jgi:type I restriction enzyme M protein
MLDNTTKKRIDDCRDVLVGKVPDPKSQIEQITLALIYKFMDDMDRDAVEKLKGKAKFFTGEYEKYGWRKLFDPSLGGDEMLRLYSEALEKAKHQSEHTRAVQKHFQERLSAIQRSFYVKAVSEIHQ